jgi:hypothetical protein
MAIPVSLRSGDDPVAGNQWSGVRIAAPVGEVDPVARMRTIREVMLTARSEPAISALGGLVSSAMAWMPAQTLGAMGEAGGGVDVQASNIPGNPKPVYEGGGRILRFVPIGPLPGAAMMVVMSSNAGRCFIGVNYDTASVTDHDRFAAALRAGFDEVIAVGPKEKKAPTRTKGTKRAAGTSGAKR